MTFITRPMLQYTAAGLLLLSVIPAASADCFIDDNGREVCEGLPLGVRAGIGLAIFFLFMVILLFLGLARRRRMQRANQAYITNSNTYQPYPAPAYNQNSYNPANMPQGPQYPPQSYTPYEQYNGAPEYTAQPYLGTPPQYPSYVPPPGPPPMQKE